MEEELNKEFDVIVIGTGFTESLVAAACARIGKKVLHLDSNDYYGDCWSSFSLSALLRWADKVNASEIDTSVTNELGLSDPNSVFSNVSYKWLVPDQAEIPPQPADLNKSNFINGSEQRLPVLLEQGGNDNESNNRGNRLSNPQERQSSKELSNQDFSESHQVPFATKPQPDQSPSGSDPISSKRELDIPEGDYQNFDKVPDSLKEPASCPIGIEDAKSQNETTDFVNDGVTIPSNGSETSLSNHEYTKWTRESLLKASRKFNIDLAPKVLYAKGSLVDLLVSSNVSRYTEFKCVTQILTWVPDKEDSEWNEDTSVKTGRIIRVPCSRGEVFTSDAISLVEKRLLMKFLQNCLRDEAELKEETLAKYLASEKLTPKLSSFVLTCIAMSSEQEGISAREGVRRARLFLSSLGVYGPLPFLFPLYGSGEVPQAFCRLCAVFEGVYMLRQPVESLLRGEDGDQGSSPSLGSRLSGVSSEGRSILGSHVVMAAGYVPSKLRPFLEQSGSLSRAVYITDRSLSVGDSGEPVSLVRVPRPERLPYTLLQLPHTAAVCPPHTHLVQVVCGGVDSVSDMEYIEERLFSVPSCQSLPEGIDRRPRVLFAFYFNQAIYDDDDAAKTEGKLPPNLHICGTPLDLLDYDAAIEKAKSVFGRMCPGEEFLPRAPDPQEIVFEPPDATESMELAS